MRSKINLNSISVILVKPKFPENIGSAARAMKNMGLSRLILVNGSSPLHPNAYKLASGAEDVLERAEEFPDLREAVSEMGCVVGTTSRKGKGRHPDLTPNSLAKKLVLVSQKNPVGLVFGSEKEGLTNEELSLCHFCLRIPSAASFPTLNLAQAVMVVCYQLFLASSELSEKPVSLARSDQMEKMFGHMEETLIRIGFLDSDHPEKMMRTLRKLFGRSQPDERDVQILQGILSRIDWHLRRKKKQ